MPRKRTKTKTRIDRKPAWLQQYLALGVIPKPEEEGVLDCFFLRGNREKLKSMWKKNSDNILRDFIEKHPGKRPFCWWIFDSPKWKKTFNGAYFEGKISEPRKRISGIGVTTFEKYPAIVPSFKFGIPMSWDEVDKTNFPRFEAQATYLKRHDLLSETESKVLSDKDFEPESLEKYIKNIRI